ncbi:MAG TPA: CAP domain-containing protein, partial [Gemmataceae bacterium]|nr:CAP domain-containing protein [Gemmataceae bacterium]
MKSKANVRHSVRSKLFVEELEVRRVLSGMQPTAAAQLFLEQLNDIRANPAAYGASIGVDLSAVAPAQPLAFDPLLIQAAQQHAQDMNDRAYLGQNTPDNIDPGQRLTAL